MRLRDSLFESMPQFTGKENPTEKDVLVWLHARVDKERMTMRVFTMVGDEVIFANEFDAKSFIDDYKRWSACKKAREELRNRGIVP